MPHRPGRRAALAALISAAWPLRAALATAMPSHPGTGAAPGGPPALTYALRPARAATPHPPILFLMHGYGADEQDLMPLAALLPPEFVVVSLRAPYINAPGGYRWYESRKTGGRLDGDPGQIAASCRAVQRCIESLTQQFQADAQRVFIGGFSQGAAMTYALALPQPGRYRGAVVLSGPLLVSVARQLDPALDRTRLAMFIGQGRADDTVAFAYADEAAMQLNQWRVPLRFESYAGLGHGIGTQESADLAQWLHQTAG